jgi:hypothetical protein
MRSGCLSFAFSSARRRVSNARFVGSVSAFSSSLNLSTLAKMILRIPTSRPAFHHSRDANHPSLQPVETSATGQSRRSCPYCVAVNVVPSIFRFRSTAQINDVAQCRLSLRLRKYRCTTANVEKGHNLRIGTTFQSRDAYRQWVC